MHADFEPKIAQALSVYGLDAGLKSTPLTGGTANVSFVVHAAEPVILTFCVDLAPHQAHRIAGLLHHLSQHDFTTNQLRPTQTGNLIGLIDGIPVIAKYFVDGTALQHVDIKQAHRMGVALAQLHQVPVPPGTPTDHGMSPTAIASLAKSASNKDFSSWIARIMPSLRESTESLPSGLVHGDLFPDNIIEAPDKTLILIDFEEARVHPFVFDIGMALLGLSHANSLSLKTTQALLSGYRTVRDLTLAETQDLPRQFTYSAAITACWRYEISHRGGVHKPHLRDWRDMQRVLEESRQWLTSGVLKHRTEAITPED